MATEATPANTAGARFNWDPLDHSPLKAIAATTAAERAVRVHDNAVRSAWRPARTDCLSAVNRRSP